MQGTNIAGEVVPFHRDWHFALIHRGQPAETARVRLNSELESHKLMTSEAGPEV